MRSNQQALSAERPVLCVPRHEDVQDRLIFAAVDLDDAELVERTLRGEREAFDQIVRRHERPVYALLLRMTRHAENAEDLTQETFLRALRSLAGFDVRRPLRPWIYRIAVNLALSARSRARATIVSLDDSEAGTGQLIDPKTSRPFCERFDQEELCEKVRKAVAQLAPDDAVLFNLCYCDEMSHKAIAAVMERSPGAVTVALHRLRLRIRRIVFGENLKDQPRGGGRK